MLHYQDHITSNRQVMLGKPVIKGTKITVELILKKMAEGAKIEDILLSYLHLKADSILACLIYTSEVIAHEEVIPLEA
ncbi:DUF433 domain-containing protein [Emticicia sp.]|uniref:DUF433 domain-containing protein n=1 Tax=Emticicia sp. TaxID=1930953 RepID=UPI003750945E